MTQKELKERIVQQGKYEIAISIIGNIIDTTNRRIQELETIVSEIEKDDIINDYDLNSPSLIRSTMSAIKGLVFPEESVLFHAKTKQALLEDIYSKINQEICGLSSKVAEINISNDDKSCTDNLGNLYVASNKYYITTDYAAKHYNSSNSMRCNFCNLNIFCKTHERFYEAKCHYFNRKDFTNIVWKLKVE